MIFDPVYLAILAVAGLFSLVTSMRVKSCFKKWDRIPTASGLTGAEVAREILRQSGIFDVQVERVSGFLSDHYDPSKKMLRLSPNVFDSRSVAAAGVAAHEVGHALQHAKGYWPLQMRTVLAPAAAAGSNLSTIMLMAGVFTGMLGLVKLGVLFFALMVLFVVITLPVEFDASNRAKQLLPELGLTQGNEGRGVAAVLDAAALTYVAAAVTAVLQLFYWLWRAGLLSGRDD